MLLCVHELEIKLLCEALRAPLPLRCCLGKRLHRSGLVVASRPQSEQNLSYTRWSVCNINCLDLMFLESCDLERETSSNLAL